MGRRRRKVVRFPKKQVPHVFLCPHCGKRAIRVAFLREEEKAVVSCGGCELVDQFTIKPHSKDVDVYCEFTDKYYSHRRETPQAKTTKQ